MLSIVEEKLKVANNKLKEITNEYQNLKRSCNTLSKALKSCDSNPNPSLSRAKKPLALCTPQYQHKRMKEVAQNVNTALLFTEDEDFKATEVELTSKSTHDKIVCIEQDGQLKLATKDTSDEPCSSETIEQILYIKEKFNTSNQAYHEIAMINKELPHLCTVIKVAKKLDEQCIIHSTPGKLKGV